MEQARLADGTKLREVALPAESGRERMRSRMSSVLPYLALRIPTPVRRAGSAALRWRARGRLATRDRPLRLCLGSGRAPIPNWVNVDLHLAADVILDLAYGLPVAAASVEYIYSEHLIEHFSLEDGLRLMRECRRVLVPRGVLRIATPDLAFLVHDYARSWRDHDWVSWPEHRWIDSGARMLNQAFRGWGHHYLYDFEDLSARLEAAGFAEVRRCAIGDSEHPALRGLETRRDSRLVVEAEP